MKNIIIILLLSLSFSGLAQKPEAWKPEPWRVITLYSTSIILNAVGDGLNDSGHKDWGHACNATSIGLLVTSPFIIDYDKSKWGYYLTSYVGLRYSLFDASYNLSRGLPYDYIGKTATVDKVFGKVPANFRTFTKGISLIVSVSLPITKVRR